ncbi:MAG: hypothetical protein D6722_02335 [Bacteroidetes bacterium]|nr:MAG: hypothetical protein D6722_02335 [Bacteroidota bacterium]
MYTAGAFPGTVDFDPGPGNSPLTSAGSFDVFVQKMDPDGNFLWARSFGGNMVDNAHALSLDASGNVYTTGSFSGTVDFDPGAGTAELTASVIDIFVQKMDPSGQFLWARSFGGSGLDEGYAIACDALGHVYTCGTFSGTVDFDPDTGVFNLTAVGSDDIFVQKLDADGNFRWAVSFGGAEADRVNSIGVDGDLYLTGSFGGTADFDPGAGTINLTAVGSDDIFVQKLDTAGALLWAVSLGGAQEDYGTSLSVDALGNVYTTGAFKETVDFDPGAGTDSRASVGSYDLFVLKLDADGVFQWATSLGWTNRDEGQAITADAAGNVYLTGAFRETVDFDPGPGTASLSSDLGSADVFCAEVKPGGGLPLG